MSKITAIIEKFARADVVRAGVTSEMSRNRGHDALKLVVNDVWVLCRVITDNGDPVENNMTMKQLTFGKLFEIYTEISSNLIGTLIRARSYSVVEFEGEILYHNKDDGVVVYLMRSMEEVRAILDEKIAPVNAMIAEKKTSMIMADALPSVPRKTISIERALGTRKSVYTVPCIASTTHLPCFLVSTPKLLRIQSGPQLKMMSSKAIITRQTNAIASGDFALPKEFPAEAVASCASDAEIASTAGDYLDGAKNAKKYATAAEAKPVEAKTAVGKIAEANPVDEKTALHKHVQAADTVFPAGIFKRESSVQHEKYALNMGTQKATQVNFSDIKKELSASVIRSDLTLEKNGATEYWKPLDNITRKPHTVKSLIATFENSKVRRMPDRISSNRTLRWKQQQDAEEAQFSATRDRVQFIQSLKTYKGEGEEEELCEKLKQQRKSLILNEKKSTLLSFFKNKLIQFVTKKEQTGRRRIDKSQIEHSNTKLENMEKIGPENVEKFKIEEQQSEKASIMSIKQLQTEEKEK